MATRKQEKEERREARLAAEQTQQEKDARRKRLYAIVVGGVLLLGVIGAVVAVAAGGGGGDGDSDAHKAANTAQEEFGGASAPPEQQLTVLDEAADAAGCVLKNPAVAGSEHVPPGTKVDYTTTPPTSGSHYVEPADEGVYAELPDPRNTVHTLEHGRIYIQYQPTLSKERIAQLGGLFNEDPYHMVISPNGKMPYDVSVTAWGQLATCKKVTDETFDVIRTFRDRYRDQGPEQVP